MPALHTPTNATSLIFGRHALWELEVDALASQTLIDFTVGIEPVVHTTSLLLIEHDLQHLAAVFLGTDALADDLDRVDKVGEDGVVHCCERAGAWALLCLARAAAVAALGARQDAAAGNDENVTVGEFLLEFASEAVILLLVSP